MLRTLSPLLLSFAVSGAALGAWHFQAPQEAEACGCFVPPDPTVPIVQAGERILFGMKDGEVTAHIQVQYSGAASDFGWLLPMPSVPEMELGSDELFAQLTAQTQPKYRLDREYLGNCPFDPNRFGQGGGAPSNDSAGGESGEGGGSPLVLRDTLGPYDYAVLRADAKQPMLDWLDENGFFVPAGTEDVVDTYIKPGAFFLALKLQSGEDAGDIQPVVLKYQSDLPMIPIILTSVAADPDMGVQVWVLGDDRAIPRNYHHTRINDAAIDWINAGANYAQVVTDAVDEIEGHHSFVTEYAGPSSIMREILDYQGRFGQEAMLAGNTGAVEFVQYLNNNGFPLFGGQGPNGFNPTFSPLILNILQASLPVPAALLEQGVTPSDYYWSIQYYLGSYRENNPEQFLDLDVEFVATDLARDLFERVVKPTLAAGSIIRDHDYLTRLFTTLSPNEMTKDPVFSFNPDLYEVSNIHSGKLVYHCQLRNNATAENTPAVLTTEQGFKIVYGDGVGESDSPDSPKPWSTVLMPQSSYQEILREEGEPEVVTDNMDEIQSALNEASGDIGGCSTGGTSGGTFALLFLALAFLGLNRRKEDLG